MELVVARLTFLFLNIIINYCILKYLWYITYLNISIPKLSNIFELMHIILDIFSCLSIQRETNYDLLNATTSNIHCLYTFEIINVI